MIRLRNRHLIEYTELKEDAAMDIAIEIPRPSTSAKSLLTEAITRAQSYKNN